MMQHNRDSLSISWAELTIECSSEIVHNAAWVVRISISCSFAQQTTLNPAAVNYLDITLSPMLFQQMTSITPFCVLYETQVSDPSILHLIHLLRSEMQQPQILSQMFVSSIVNVLTLYVFNLELDRVSNVHESSLYLPQNGRVQRQQLTLNSALAAFNHPLHLNYGGRG